jgi:hypothetical protein
MNGGISIRMGGQKLLIKIDLVKAIAEGVSGG